MAILAFRFVLAVFLAYFLRKEDKQALLSLLLEVLGSREADGEEVDGEETNSKVVYGKDIGNGKFLLSIKSYKERFSIYFLKLY